nr:MAG TPA: hypothetical protein [Caudoviricetes sp.]
MFSLLFKKRAVNIFFSVDCILFLTTIFLVFTVCTSLDTVKIVV